MTPWIPHGRFRKLLKKWAIRSFALAYPRRWTTICRIPIAVRPDYAGGVSEIIDAYKLAKDRCSVNILISLLKKLDYIYPYQQVIGFYLERAGYSSSLLEKLNEMKSEYNFYLCYKIEQKEFSERWKLFYPKGI